MEHPTSAARTPAETGQLIQNSIDELKARFNEFPDVFLTEEDVRSHLFSKLLGDGFSVIRVTQDGSRSIELHSEVRWYGHGETIMRYRSDIVLIDASTLITTASGLELPSKQYGFDGFFTIIELKLRRSNKESDAAFLKRIGKDIEKFRKISRYVQREFGGYVVIFDKARDLEQDVRALRNADAFTIVYSFSNPRNRNWEHRPSTDRH